MARENFRQNPKLYGEEGKVRDDRLSRKMAEEELRFRKPFDDKGITPNQQNQERAAARAEHVGSLYYREHGVEVPRQLIPSKVMKAFAKVMSGGGQGEFKDQRKVEFRKIEHGEKDVEYLMLFGFEQTSPGEWAYRRVSCDAEGKIGSVYIREIELADSL